MNTSDLMKLKHIDNAMGILEDVSNYIYNKYGIENTNIGVERFDGKDVVLRITCYNTKSGQPLEED